MTLFEIVWGYIISIISLVRRFFFKDKNYEDLYYKLILEKNYDEALRLAQREPQLDISLVYKCKWRNSGITVLSINSVLGKIQDKLWAINECAKTVPISYEACRCLLEYGLKEANLRLLYELGNDEESNGKISNKRGQGKNALLEDNVSEEAILGLIDFNNLNDQQRELCRIRYDLLRFEHSLLCYESILGDYRTIQQSFDHVFYEELRRKSPLNICLHFANNGEPKAVETCLLFYLDELKPHHLAILSNFPETLSPYQYRNLLPCLRKSESYFEWKNPAHQTPIKRTIDWSSCDATTRLEEILREESEAFEKEFYDNNPTLSKFLQPLTDRLLSEWYISRSLEMESRTLLSTNAVQLLHLGSELNISNLKKTHDELVEFYSIIYDSYTDCDIYLSFSEFNAMPKMDRLKLMVRQFKSNEPKYKLLGTALAESDNGKMMAEILEFVIELRKRDEKLQMSYLNSFM